MNFDMVTNAGALGAIGIAVNANNVDLNFNNHTFSVSGEFGQAVATIGTSANVWVHNGTISGTQDTGQSGVFVLTSDVTVSDMNFSNVGTAGGVQVQGINITSPSASSYTLTELSGFVIERCQFSSNVVGIALFSPINSGIIRDCAIDSSVQFGISASGRFINVNNMLIENCNISNSGLHGIFTTFYQNNWVIRNCQVSNSGLDGMILAAMQNLLVDNCQVYDSGANGIMVGIRLGNNVEIADTQVFNSGAYALRVDDVENLIVHDCEFTNYIMTGTPVVKIQDVYNGNISNCYVNSLANLADGMVLRNCHGLTVEDCGVNIVCTTTQNIAPVGINLKGSVTGTVLRNCNISGTPSIGINVGLDSLSLNNQGVIIENCNVQGAKQQGICLVEAVSSAVYDSNVMLNSLDGIVTNSCSQCSIRNNNAINNGRYGINDMASSVGTQVYHNFANHNGTDYSGTIPLQIPYSSLSDTTGWYVNVSE